MVGRYGEDPSIFGAGTGQSEHSHDLSKPGAKVGMADSISGDRSIGGRTYTSGAKPSYSLAQPGRAPTNTLGYLQDGLWYPGNGDGVDWSRAALRVSEGRVDSIPGTPGAKPAGTSWSDPRLTSYLNPLRNPIDQVGDFISNPLNRGIIGAGRAAYEAATGPSPAVAANAGAPYKNLPPEAIRAIREQLQRSYGFSVPNGQPEVAAMLLERAYHVEASLMKGESFEEAWKSSDGGAELWELYNTAGTTQSTAGDGVSGQSGGASGRAGGSGGAGGSSGSGGSGGASGFADAAAGARLPGLNNLPSGEYEGVQVTPDLLREFVESDFSLGFNAMVNNMRDAGGAMYFLNWLQNQFQRFRGEYLGDLASQALNGEIPKGGVVDFFQRKGLLPGTPTDDVNAEFAQFQQSASRNAAGGSSGRSGGSSGGGSGGGDLGPVPSAESGAAPRSEGGSGTVNPSAGQGPGLTPVSPVIAEMMGLG